MPGDAVERPDTSTSRHSNANPSAHLRQPKDANRELPAIVPVSIGRSTSQLIHEARWDAIANPDPLAGRGLLLQVHQWVTVNLVVARETPMLGLVNLTLATYRPGCLEMTAPPPSCNR